MTKRDDYYKTLGRVSILLGTVKGLGGNPVIQNNDELKKLATTANEAIAGLNDRLAVLAAGTEAATPKPMVKALLMPAVGSKEEFALAAIADSMGLRVLDVTVPDETASRPAVTVTPRQVVQPTSTPKPVEAPKPAEPEEPLDDEAISDAVIKTFSDLSQMDVKFVKEHEALHKELGKNHNAIVEAERKAEGVSFNPQKDYIENGVIMSKKTGLPKRPYVRTGQFTDDKIKARSEAARTSGRKTGNRYTARRMS